MCIRDSNLPEVADRNAINVLWLPMVQGSDDAARLRPFDVVVVKSMAAFGHLKAINVRTAYIPDAINIKNPATSRPNGKAMFYGDKRGFSLPLYLAGRADMSVDVYGKGFENVWPNDEIMPDTPQPEDFQTYSAVLLDQSDEAVRDELVSPQVIEVIENGGLPYLRFNSGIYKIFGEALPMYGNEQEFAAGLREDVYKRRGHSAPAAAVPPVSCLCRERIPESAFAGLLLLFPVRQKLWSGLGNKKLPLR